MFVESKRTFSTVLTQQPWLSAVLPHPPFFGRFWRMAVGGWRLADISVYPNGKVPLYKINGTVLTFLVFVLFLVTRVRIQFDMYGHVTRYRHYWRKLSKLTRETNISPKIQPQEFYNLICTDTWLDIDTTDANFRNWRAKPTFRENFNRKNF